MTFPIVQRELLISSRKPLTFWSRILAALGAFAAVLLIVGIDPNVTVAGSLGFRLFLFLTNAAFFLCLFGGVLLTADCLSVEKREGTLGLLFLTDLKGYDVVLGKFAAKSITALFCLLAIVPMLAIPILLGGVTGPTFWRVILALFNTAFLSLSIGIFVSVLCRDARNVFAVSEFIVFLLMLLPSAASIFFPAWMGWFGLVSPGIGFRSAFTNFGTQSHFLLSFICLHLLGWMCLLAASLRVQTSWQEGQKHKSERRKWWRATHESRLALRRKLLPINPLLWLESRDAHVRIVLTIAMIGTAIACWFINASPRALHWSQPGAAVISIILLHFVLTLLMAFDAGGRLVHARADGALAIVLSTGLSVEEIIRGEVLAFKRMFFWAFAVILTFDLLWFICVWKHAHSPNERLEGLLALIGFLIVLLANAFGLICCGLARGLRATRAIGAVFVAYFQIVILPFLFFLLFTTALRDFSPSLLVFTLLNVVSAFVFGHSSYETLVREFREALTGHASPPADNLSEDYALMK